MKHIVHTCMAALLLTALTSCEKVIDVKLNNATQQYVVEAEINDRTGPYTVTITRTRDFTENNAFEKVGGATITITDESAGITDTLNEAAAGIYRTSSIEGMPGHIYRLHVLVNGQLFTATSAMPVQAVAIDTLYAGKSSFGGEDVFMTPQFRDPSGKGNYYRVKQWVRGIQVKGYRVRNDEASDGLTYRSQLFYDTGENAGNPLIQLNDSISAELQCLNKQVYDYYRTLEDVTGDNSATPANPLTNITGGALGIFNTCTSRQKSAVAVY